MVHTPAATRWSAIIDRQEASGQTIRAFAEANDLNASTLAWWRSRLGRAKRRGKAEPVDVRFTVLEVAEPEQVHGGADRTVVLALEGRAVQVVVDEQTDLALLRRVLDALC